MTDFGVFVRIQAHLRGKSTKQLNCLRLGILIVEANGQGPDLRAIDFCKGRVEDDRVFCGN